VTDLPLRLAVGDARDEIWPVPKRRLLRRTGDTTHIVRNLSEEGATVRSMNVDVVIRAQRGERDAFAELIDANGDRLLAVARRILRDPVRAEDAVQQALVAIWRSLPGLRDPARFDAWSYRLLVNACHAEERESRRWLPNLFGAAAEPMSRDASDAIAERDQLERAFRRLSVDHRAVVVLRYYLDLAPDQVAAALGIPGGTARSRLRHAMRQMRAALEADSRPVIREVIE
jgi:RNA polymerase sigma-70 factor (ECF subfamily)